MKDFRNNTPAWCAFLITYHLICEMIPMTYIFCHQIRCNIARLKTRQMMMSLCKGATDD